MFAVLESDMNLTVCITLDSGVNILDRFVSFRITSVNKSAIGMYNYYCIKSVTAHESIPTGFYMWQSQVENEHYSTLSGLIRLVISLECFIEITPDFMCPFMND